MDWFKQSLVVLLNNSKLRYFDQYGGDGTSVFQLGGHLGRDVVESHQQLSSRHLGKILPRTHVRKIESDRRRPRIEEMCNCLNPPGQVVHQLPLQELGLSVCTGHPGQKLKKENREFPSRQLVTCETIKDKNTTTTASPQSLAPPLGCSHPVPACPATSWHGPSRSRAQDPLGRRGRRGRGGRRGGRGRRQTCPLPLKAYGQLRTRARFKWETISYLIQMYLPQRRYPYL